MIQPRIRSVFVLLACAVIGACAASSDEAPPGGETRAQVKADLANAIRLGDIRVGDSDKTLAEIYPQRYAAARAQAAAERASAAAAAR